ncbi:MAG: TolC family protein, partial [Pseudopedobacter saltans]
MRKIVLVLRSCVCLLGLLISCGAVKAQDINSKDSLSLTLDAVDGKFISNNLSLLAQRYNIDVQKAQVIQAKLYPNPNVSVDQIAYNQHSKSILPFSQNGEFTAAVSQLIILAGKRNKSVKLAQANVTLSEVQFMDLVRTLKYAVHSDFYNL